MKACSNAWTVHAEPRPELEAYLGDWIGRHLAGYTGMVNFETIGGRIIEAHLRFADQWPDLYGDGWVKALVGLYAKHDMAFRRHITAAPVTPCPSSGAMAGPIGIPTPKYWPRIRKMPGVSSVQITFHEDKKPEQHAMPPGGFRLGIVNAFDLEVWASPQGIVSPKPGPPKTILSGDHA